MTSIIKWLGYITTAVGSIAILMSFVGIYMEEGLLRLATYLMFHPIGLMLFVTICLAPGGALLFWAHIRREKQLMEDQR